MRRSPAFTWEANPTVRPIFNIVRRFNSNTMASPSSTVPLTRLLYLHAHQGAHVMPLHNILFRRLISFHAFNIGGRCICTFLQHRMCTLPVYCIRTSIRSSRNIPSKYVFFVSSIDQERLRFGEFHFLHDFGVFVSELNKMRQATPP